MDNSHSEIKVDIRRRFAEKVGASTCFDLFCGTGFMASNVWAPRFDRVVCVDKSAKQLEDFPALPNMEVYCGDNAKLLTGLLVKHGWPNVFDLDAYGYADTLVQRILTARTCDKTFAIFSTNGNMKARHKGSKTAVPKVWGFGHGLSFAQFSAGFDAILTCDYTHLREWAEDGGKEVLDFEGHRLGPMAYWAAIVAPRLKEQH